MLIYYSFVIYQLRTSYLTHIQDGIGERLINIDTSVLNDPAFRAAGWVPDESTIKRTYSPPIPTSGGSDYFQAPPQSAGLPSTPGLGDDEDDGPVTGARDSNDTVGPAPIRARRARQRNQQLRDEEDEDSSDLSDESNDETAEVQASQRPANQIRFAKMPVRGRADSSPARVRERAASSPERPGSEGEQRDGPSLMVTSPSRPPERNWSRRENWGTAQSMKPGRARRDTATSSEVSSEGDSLDPSVFNRRSIRAPGTRRPPQKAKDRIAEEGHEMPDESTRPSTAGSDDLDKSEMSATSQEGRSDDEDDVSDGVSIASSGFSEDDANSLLQGVPPIATSSLEPEIGKSSLKSHTPSPRKNKSGSIPEKPELQELPPPRPISTIQPVSALAAAIKARNRKPGNVFERFASADGEKASDPLYIKIYVPSSSDAEEPMELQMRKSANDSQPVIVADAIGYALLRYGEKELKPKITGQKANVNKWTFRIVDDGEVDDDFPPLGRTKPMSDFTMNNNRPQRGRARDKPWDEFALVEASDDQFHEQERETPSYSIEARAAAAAEEAMTPSTPAHTTGASTRSASESAEQPPNIMTGPHTHPKPPKPPTRAPSISDPPPPRSSSFAATSMMRPSATRQNTNPTPLMTSSTNPLPFVRSHTRESQLMDAPSSTTQMTAQRSGAPRLLNVHFADGAAQPRILPLEVTTDTYISEVFDTVARHFALDKGQYVLRVAGTATVAPTDRMVEALGDRSDLNLTRRNFTTDGVVGLSGSPGSSSPNAPLLMTNTGTPTKASKSKGRKRGDGESGFAGGYAGGFAGYTSAGVHPLAQHADLLSNPAALAANSSFKRWNVVRKQPMSFTPSAPRVLAVDGESLYIMPPEGRRAGYGGDDKTRTVPFESVIGVKVNKKHARSFRVVVFRGDVGRDAKRYDFEAGSADGAREIVAVVEAGVRGVKGAGFGGM